MIILSIYGLFRTLLIIIGVFVILRVIGRFMIAKRNMDEHNELEKARKTQEKLRQESEENFGKTTISKIGKSKKYDGDFVDFEEIKED